MVSANLEPSVALRVHGRGEREQDVDAVVDTGFNGFLTLPPPVVRQLDLPRIGQSRVVVASGREEILDLYEAAILWDGQWHTVETEATDIDPLVGMSLLRGHSLYVQAVPGGRVLIESLP